MKNTKQLLNYEVERMHSYTSLYSSLRFLFFMRFMDPEFLKTGIFFRIKDFRNFKIPSWLKIYILYFEKIVEFLWNLFRNEDEFPRFKIYIFWENLRIF